MPLALLAFALAGVLGALALWLHRGSGPGGRPGEQAAVPAATAAPLADLARPAAGPTTDARSAGGSPAPAATARVALGAGLAFRGAVVAATDGAPIEGALVALLGGELERSARTDAAGRFEIGWPDGLPASLHVSHAAWVDARSPRVALAEPARIELRPSGAILGRLQVDGRPRAAVPISLWSYSRTRYAGAPDLEALTDGEGRFVFEDLAPDDYALGARSEEWPLVFVTNLRLSGGERLWRTLEAHSGARLAGEVVERGSRRPIPGVEVVVRPERQGVRADVESLGERRATSGIDGRFTIAGLGPGRIEVELRTPWGHRDDEDLDVPGLGEVLARTFAIRAPARLSGSVRDSRGRPAAGARVAAAPAEESRDLEWGEHEALLARSSGVQHATCDAQGRFELEALPAGEPLVIAALPDERGRAAGELPAFERGLRLEEGEQRGDLALQTVAGARLRGLVVDLEGAPVAGATVDAGVRVGRAWSDWARAESGPDGGFELGPLPLGAVRLEAGKAGFRDARELATLGEQEAAEPLRLVLEPAHSIAGWIVDTAGYAVPGAYARAELAGEDRRRRGRSARADEYGRFVIDDLEEGLWRLEARAVGWRAGRDEARELALPGAGEVVLELEPQPRPEPATLTGEIVARGSGAPVEGLRLEGVRGAIVELDRARFTVTNVPPGRRELRAAADGYVTLAFEPLQVSPGGLVDLGLHEMRRATELSVEIVGPDGAPVTGATVELVAGPARDEERVRLRPDRRRRGSYSHDEVPRGNWSLRILHRGHAELRRDLQVTGRRMREAVRLEPGRPRGR